MALKTVLITGCSIGGIGHALAREFQKRGLVVFATARSLSKMADLETLPNMTLLSLDVTSPSDIAAAVEHVKAKTGGKLDYLVNNSGRSAHIPMLEHNIDEAKDLFDVNFWGIFRMIQAFAPLLIEAKGTVVNIGSVNGCLNLPFCGVYNASKASIHSLDETLHMELKPLGVRVLTVITGTVRTNISANSLDPKLQPNSMYKPAEKWIEKLQQGQAYPNKMDASVYAEQVVGDVLSGVTGKTWRGANAVTTRCLAPILPTSVKEKILTNDTNLDKVGRS